MIAVSVDSLNGSIVQAEIISSALIHKAKELKCPLYTFAEATSLGPGYIILSSGTKLHADPHSLIGGISASFQQLGLSKALKDLKIKANLLSTAQTRLNPFEELKKQDEDWIVKILSNYDAVIKEIINNNRKQVSNSESAWKGEIFNGKKALEQGLVDKIADLSSVVLEEFPDARVIRLKNKTSKIPLIKSNWIGDINYNSIPQELADQILDQDSDQFGIKLQFEDSVSGSKSF